MPTAVINPEPPVIRRVEVAASRAGADEFAARPDAVKIATEHVSIMYGQKIAVRDVSLKRTSPVDPSPDWPVRQREVDLPAMPQSDERPDPERQGQGRDRPRR